MNHSLLAPPDAELRKAFTIIKNRQIPSVPELIIKLNDELSKPHPATDRVANLVSRDPATSGFVLKTVNSAAFALQQEIESIHQAVVLLGLEQIRNLVIASAFQTHVQATTPAAKRISSDSQEVGLAAARIAGLVEGLTADEAYLTGLLHDCGAILLAERWPAYEGMLQQKISHPVGLIRAENTRIGTNHTAIGYLFGRHWKLPEHICLAIYHHHSATVSHMENSRLRALTAVLILANALVDRKYVEASGETLERIQYITVAKSELMLEPEVLDELQQEVTLGFH